jgi:hypothetical protein
MDGHLLLRWLAQACGLLLIGVVLADVFLTVLYARIHSGIISNHLGGWTWRVFRLIGGALPKHCDKVLSFCGPTILVLLVGVWITGLILGGALLVYPSLGTSIRATSGGATPTDFITALYVAGDSLTTVGASDFSPQTRFFRLFYTANSVVGMCVITLTVTYFLQVYNALHGRNTFALKVHLATGETGDAAELIAGIGAEGEFRTGYTHLAEISAEMTSFKESHHFHSVLLYFRFEEVYYSVTRLALVCLDTVALIKTALDDQEYAWLKESAAVAHLWRASIRLVVLLGTELIPGAVPERAEPPDPQLEECWRRRHAAAIRRLRQAGVHTIADEQAGAAAYVKLRNEWDRYITTFIRYMAHDPAEIDPAGATPEGADERPAFQDRLRSAG